MKAHVIDSILHLATHSSSKVIRRKMLDEKPLRVLGEILPREYLDRTVEDIPISAFGNMSETRVSGIPEDEPTWLGTLKQYIHGNGWKDEVIDYFECEIKDRDFPARGARGALQVHSYNGICFGSNGSHRLVGLVCYLAAKYGDDAVARGVNHSATLYGAAALSKLQGLYNKSTSGMKLASQLRLQGNLEIGVDNVICIDENYYTYDNNDFILLSPHSTSWSDKLIRKEKIRQRKALYDRQDYTTLGHDACKRLFKSTWLNEAISTKVKTGSLSEAP
tara:strand:- start:133 stop:963 length:831 start_codon:yes stop_codon:yes gene_type:complete